SSVHCRSLAPPWPTRFPYTTLFRSLVAPDRLRFDFTHIGAMSEEEIKEVERRVNEQIWANNKVEVMIKPLDEAKAMGAMALFGEDRKSTRLNSSQVKISYAVFCLKK